MIYYQVLRSIFFEFLLDSRIWFTLGRRYRKVRIFTRYLQWYGCSANFELTSF